MKFIIFFIYVRFVYSELHTFMTTYTGINGPTFAGPPEFSAVTTLDGQQIDYYDSKIKKLIPKQDWMRDYVSTELWKQDTEIRENVQQIYKNNIYILMERFNQSRGVHTYQRMYGCDWDDETDISHGFDEYSYDAEDFISLDLKELRYNASLLQGKPTVMKWNNDRAQLELLQQYYRYECVYWLKKFLHVYKATFKKTEPPKVSLLQKNPEYYVECHVTGFHFRETTVLWRTIGLDIKNFSELVESGDTLPNEDGTFQRTVALKFPPEEWKTNQYVCVVEHESLTEPIQKILSVNDTKSSTFASYASYIMYTVIIILVILILIALYWNKKKKIKEIKKIKPNIKPHFRPHYRYTRYYKDPYSHNYYYY